MLDSSEGNSADLLSGKLYSFPHSKVFWCEDQSISIAPNRPFVLLEVSDYFETNLLFPKTSSSSSNIANIAKNYITICTLKILYDGKIGNLYLYRKSLHHLTKLV